MTATGLEQNFLLALRKRGFSMRDAYNTARAVAPVKLGFIADRLVHEHGCESTLIYDALSECAGLVRYMLASHGGDRTMKQLRAGEVIIGELVERRSENQSEKRFCVIVNPEDREQATSLGFTHQKIQLISLSDFRALQNSPTGSHAAVQIQKTSPNEPSTQRTLALEIPNLAPTQEPDSKLNISFSNHRESPNTNASAPAPIHVPSSSKKPPPAPETLVTGTHISGIDDEVINTDTAAPSASDTMLSIPIPGQEYGLELDAGVPLGVSADDGFDATMAHNALPPFAASPPLASPSTVEIKLPAIDSQMGRALGNAFDSTFGQTSHDEMDREVEVDSFEEATMQHQAVMIQEIDEEPINSESIAVPELDLKALAHSQLASQLTPTPEVQANTNEATKTPRSDTSGFLSDSLPVVEVDHAELSQDLSDYEVTRTLGEGGMATVYLAKETPSNREVALKVMAGELSAESVFVQRFIREAKTSASLIHPHIVRVLGYGESEGKHFMAMEVVDGGTPADLSEKLNNKLPVPAVVMLLDSVLDALSYAHEKDVIHRDLKPANIMITRGGRIKLTDFGIAKCLGEQGLTKTGDVIGTPSYMSPEQTMGRELSGRSDLFSIGIVAYRLLAGFNPYFDEQPATTLLNIATKDSPKIYEAVPGLPEDLERFMNTLTAKDPEDRYRDAAEAREALSPIAQRMRKEFGHVFQKLLLSPIITNDEIADQIARPLIKEARKLEAQNPEAAVLLYYRASLSAPKNQDALKGFTSLCSKHGYNFNPSTDPGIQKLEAKLEKKENDPGLLRKLTTAYRKEGNIHRAVCLLKRYTRLKNDPVSERELNELAPPQTPSSSLDASTNGALQGRGKAAIKSKIGRSSDKPSERGHQKSSAKGASQKRAKNTPADKDSHKNSGLKTKKLPSSAQIDFANAEKGSATQIGIGLRLLLWALALIIIGGGLYAVVQGSKAPAEKASEGTEDRDVERSNKQKKKRFLAQ